MDCKVRCGAPTTKGVAASALSSSMLSTTLQNGSPICCSTVENKNCKDHISNDVICSPTVNEKKLVHNKSRGPQMDSDMAQSSSLANFSISALLEKLERCSMLASVMSTGTPENLQEAHVPSDVSQDVKIRKASEIAIATAAAPGTLPSTTANVSVDVIIPAAKAVSQSSREQSAAHDGAANHHSHDGHLCCSGHQHEHASEFLYRKQVPFNAAGSSALVKNLANLNFEISADREFFDGVELVLYSSELEMPHIMRLITKDLSEPYSIYTYRYFIHNWPYLCFLAIADHNYIGAIVCKLDYHKNGVRRGYIAMLAVDENYRRKKIGSKLVEKAIMNMVAKDCDEVVLETEVTNKSALGLYERLGFVRDKRLFRYYLNGRDAYRLKLWLKNHYSSSCFPMYT